MASVSAIYFPRGRERTAMRASLTPTLTTPHVCLMADPRSLPGLLTICGGLTSRYPITVHRRSFLFIVNRDKARCIAFICTAGHVRRSVLSFSGTRSFPRSCRVFIFFFSPSPPLLSLSLFHRYALSRCIFDTRESGGMSLQRRFFFFNGKSPRCSPLVVVAAVTDVTELWEQRWRSFFFLMLWDL